MKLRSGRLTSAAVVLHTAASDWPSAKLVYAGAITAKSVLALVTWYQSLRGALDQTNVRHNRYAVMVLAQTLMNSAPSMREELYPVYKATLSKFYTYTGPEYPFEFVMKLKKAFTPLDKHASKIQRAFRESRGYAMWSGHPDRLKAQGFFDV